MTDRFAGTSPDPVERGAELNIKFKNPALAGETITVPVIDDEGRTASVDVKLDASGEGSVKWTVPSDWGDFATLQHSTSTDHTVAVTSPPGPATPKKKTPAPPRRSRPHGRPRRAGSVETPPLKRGAAGREEPPLHRIAACVLAALCACQANEDIHGTAYMAPAFGKVSHQTYGSAPNLNDSANGYLVSGLLQAAGNRVGAGATFDVMQTSEDIHTAGVDLEQVDVFPFLAVGARAERVRFAVRGGPFITNTELGGGGIGTLDSSSWGVRLGMAPEFDLSRSNTVRMTLAASAFFGLGETEIDATSTGTTQTWASTCTSYGLDIGFRAAFPNAFIGVSYIYRNLNVAESDVTASSVIKEADYGFSGAQLSLGVTW